LGIQKPSLRVLSFLLMEDFSLFVVITTLLYINTLNSQMQASAMEMNWYGLLSISLRTSMLLKMKVVLSRSIKISLNIKHSKQISRMKEYSEEDF
jgi:hypothetical protein